MIEILPPSTCHVVAHFLHVDLYFQRFMGFFLIFKNYFDLSIHYLFLAVLGLCCCAGFTLVVESWGCCLVAVHGLLTAVGFSCAGARARQSTGSVVVAHGLSCSLARGIFLDQGSNLNLLHWQADSLPLNHQGSPQRFMFY